MSDDEISSMPCARANAWEFFHYSATPAHIDEHAHFCVFSKIRGCWNVRAPTTVRSVVLKDYGSLLPRESGSRAFKPTLQLRRLRALGPRHLVRRRRLSRMQYDSPARGYRCSHCRGAQLRDTAKTDTRAAALAPVGVLHRLRLWSLGNACPAAYSTTAEPGRVRSAARPYRMSLLRAGPRGRSTSSSASPF